LIADDIVIEPELEITLDETEKRELTTLNHVVYRITKKTEEATVSDYGRFPLW